ILFFAASAFLLFCSGDIFAAERLELTLSEAINMSLKENLSLAGERINPKIAEADIKFREGEFDPNVDLKATESYRKSRSASLLLGTEERTANGDISLGGKVNTGTTYELKWANERVRSNSGYLTTNPYYTSELALTMTQPLLKGIGKDIQESNLNVARNNYEASRLILDEKSIGIIADTARAYWDLTFARNALKVAGFSLELAQNLLAEVKAKIDAGALASVEVYKAEAEVSLREEAHLKAGKLALDAADKLRVIMNLKDWLVELIPIEKTPEPFDIPPVEASIDTALNNRKDYKQAAIAFRNKEILKKYFDNQKYPDLNIIGAVGLNNLNGTYDKTVDGLDSRDYYSWQFGLSLRIPIGNNAAGGNYLKAKHEEEKSALALKIIEQQITAEVREAWRSVQLASETIKATKKTRTAAEKRFEAEEGRFRVGMATLNDVLKFQEEYAKALSSEKKAEVDYANSIVALERAKGTLGQ
ncbi:MAG: TolC family protein, partial [Nitrospirae bacterium]